MRQSDTKAMLARFISENVAGLRLAWRSAAQSDDVAAMHITGQGAPALNSIVRWLESGSPDQLRRLLNSPPWNGNEGGADAPLALLISLGATLRQFVSNEPSLTEVAERTVSDMAEALDALTRARIRHLEEQLATDSLTGADSREEILGRLRAESARSVRHGRPLSVIYLDVDGLKRVNDERGHAAGDEILKTVARAIRANTRVADALGRLGGDEFLLVLPETGLIGAGHVANKVTEILRTEGVSVTAGAAGPPDAGPDPDELVAEANSALRSARVSRKCPG